MITTRKLPHSMTKDGKATLRGEHLVPCLESPRKNYFVGVKTGKIYDLGYLVYLGEDITPEEILGKLRLSDEAARGAQPILESFIRELTAYKIGNVVSVSFPESIRCVLKKEAEAPKSERKAKLP